MTHRPLIGRLTTALLLLLLAASSAWSATDRRKFTTSPTLAAEANALIKLLAELHYNRDAVNNTDFAQVEVDEQRTNLTRFPLFFPEKRPFFLENAGVFSAGTPQAVDLFFTRRIGIDAVIRNRRSNNRCIDNSVGSER